MTSALGASPTGYRPGRKSVVNGLATIFNVVGLTLGVVLLSLTVVGLPLAFSAGSSAIYEWRQGGEGRVLRSFGLALRDRPLRRVAVISPALFATAAGVTEAYYFVHFRGPIALMCLTVGIVTIAAGVTFSAYLLLLVTVAPEASWVALWRCAAGIVARTSVVAGPVFFVESAVAVLIGFTDPGLLVIAVPVALLWCWQRTALWGARRAGLGV